MASRNECPLIIGVGKGENFVASDVPAVLAHTREVVYLKNQEVATLTATGVELFEKTGKKLRPDVHHITWDAAQAEKGGFPHYMLKEIFEQPFAVTETTEGRISDHEVLIPEIEQLLDVKRIIIVACGTSWHSGLIGEFMLEEVARIQIPESYHRRGDTGGGDFPKRRDCRYLSCDARGEGEGGHRAGDRERCWKLDRAGSGCCLVYQGRA